MQTLLNSLRYLPTILFLVSLYVGNMLLNTYNTTNKGYYISAPLTKDDLVWDKDFVSLKEKREWCKKRYNCKLLAEVGYYEARNQHDMGVIAVMYVAINRAKSNHPIFKQQSTLKDVIYKKNQFSYLWDGSTKKGMNDKKQVDRMLVLGYDVLNGLVDSPVEDSLYYHTTQVKPNWSQHYAYTMTVGDHKFYKH